VWSLAAFYPMWAGMDDAKTVKRIMANLDKFEHEGGLVTTAKEPEVSSPLPTQWSYPNGWAPLHLLATEGMERYDYHVDAERIARKWLNANLVWFEEHGEFLEKYNMVDIHQPPKVGVYPTHPGFGWTNALFERFSQRYLGSEELPEIERIAPQAVSPLGELVRNPRKTLRKVGVKLNINPAKRLT
jgi:alpha,alpha-trehalase